MRCPLCNTWVKDKDDLQIHCIEGCNAVGNGDTHLTNARFEKAEITDDESNSNLVEIIFIWEDTKDSAEKTICLISSLAGQINLKRSTAENIFESARVIVPCGIHSCQLVVDDECYSVFDIDIDVASEVAHVILQDDINDPSEAMATRNSYFNNTRNGESSSSRHFYHQGGEDADDNYGMDVLRNEERVRNETEADETASLRSHDSNCETAKMKRRKKHLEDLRSGQSRDNLAKLAKNGVHEVQVHTAESVPKNNANAHVASMASDGRKTSTDSRAGSVYNDRRDSKGSLAGSTQESRKSSKGSLVVSAYGEIGGSRGVNEEKGEQFLEPPNGFQSDQMLRSETRRSKRLSNIARSKTGRDAPSDNGSQVDDANGTLKKSGREPKLADVPPEEKPSWGFDAENKQVEKAKVESFETATSEEVISELILKCDLYKEKLDKATQMSQRLEEENADLHQKLKDENDLLLAKEEEIGEFRATCESYETEVQRLSNGYKDLVQKSVGHEEQLKMKEDELEALERRLESILRDNKELKEENESLQTAHKLQREDMDKIIQNEVEALKDKLNSVKVGSRSFQHEEMKKASKLERQVNRLNTENERLRKQISRIKDEANSIEHGGDGIDGTVADPIPSERALIGSKFDGTKSYLPRNISPTEDLYRDVTRHDEIYRGADRVSADLKHKIYDDYSDRFLLRGTKNQAGPYSYYDANQNYLRDSETLRLKTSQLRRSDTTNGKTSFAGPMRASHFDHVTDQSSDVFKYGHTGGWNLKGDGLRDHVATRERKPKRERPRSFHGISASESDSRELRRNLKPFQHEDSSYSHTLRGDYHDTGTPDYLKKHSKPFAPDSIDDIMIGMRVLVTRSSGRTGKGIVKWKGHLQGHADQFIGIELETPNGKHDGTYEGRRYFLSQENHGIFSKFSKVVMVWGSV